MKKTFCKQPIDSDLKQYEKIKKLTTCQHDDYATGCLLGCEYIRNYYRITAVDLNKQKELDADPKAIQ